MHLFGINFILGREKCSTARLEPLLSYLFLCAQPTPFQPTPHNTQAVPPPATTTTTPPPKALLRTPPRAIEGALLLASPGPPPATPGMKKKGVSWGAYLWAWAVWVWQWAYEYVCEVRMYVHVNVCVNVCVCWFWVERWVGHDGFRASTPHPLGPLPIH